MGRTRDLFKKFRDTKGTFHAKMGSIKERNGRDLTEAEDIKKTWQDVYTEEQYKKDLHDQDNHNGVITIFNPNFARISNSIKECPSIFLFAIISTIDRKSVV